MVLLSVDLVGPKDLGVRPRNRCLLIGKIQCPKSYIGAPVLANPFVEQGLQELGTAVGGYFGRNHRISPHDVSILGDPFALSKGKCGRFLLIATRICVTDAMAEALDRAASYIPGRGATPGKPAGVLPLRWGSSGTQVELQWENREAPTTYRASGFPCSVTADAFLRALRAAELKVSDVSTPMSPLVSLPMHGVFDITFEAGAKAPTQVEFPDADGQIRKCQLRRITRATPAPPSGTGAHGIHGGPPPAPHAQVKTPSPPSSPSPAVTWASKLFPGSNAGVSPPSQGPSTQVFKAVSVPGAPPKRNPKKRFRGFKPLQDMAGPTPTVTPPDPPSPPSNTTSSPAPETAGPNPTPPPKLCSLCGDQAHSYEDCPHRQENPQSPQAASAMLHDHCDIATDEMAMQEDKSDHDPSGQIGSDDHLPNAQA